VIVVDVNLLLYAAIDGFPQHAPAHEWWVSAVNSDEVIGLTEPVIFGFLRLSTNARLIDPALEVADAAAIVRGWLDRPNVELLAPGRRHIEIALGLLEAVGTGGNLTTDVQIASYAIEYAGEVHSNDSDFGRFEGLRWVDPLPRA
jgi:uncharacterized protein